MLPSGGFLFTSLASSSVRTRLNPAKDRQSKNPSFQQEQFPSESSKRQNSSLESHQLLVGVRGRSGEAFWRASIFQTFHVQILLLVTTTTA